MCSHRSTRPAHWAQQPCTRVRRALHKINDAKYHEPIPVVDPGRPSPLPPPAARGEGFARRLSPSSPSRPHITASSVRQKPAPSEDQQEPPLCDTPRPSAPPPPPPLANLDVVVEPETAGESTTAAVASATSPWLTVPFRVPTGCVHPRMVEKDVHGWCPDCDWAHARRMGWLGIGGKVRAWGPAGRGWGG